MRLDSETRHWIFSYSPEGHKFGCHHHILTFLSGVWLPAVVAPSTAWSSRSSFILHQTQFWRILYLVSGTACAEFRSHYGPGVDSASNRNEYQEYFLGVKSGRCVRLTSLPPSCAVVTKSGNLNFLEPLGPVQACNGTPLPLLLPVLKPWPHLQLSSLYFS